MQGAVLPVAIVEVKVVGATSTLVQSGRNDLARIEWMTGEAASTHSFKALDDGNYLVIIQATTEYQDVRLDTTIEVVAPAVLLPKVESKVTTFAQMLISASGAYSVPNYTVTATASQANRKWSPYEHFSGEWFVTLAKDDLFSFKILNSHIKKYWTAIIMRLNTIDQIAVENPSILLSNPIQDSGHGITITDVSRPRAFLKKWRIVSDNTTPSNAGRISWSLGTTGVAPSLFRFGFAHQLKVRLLSVSGSSGAAVIRVKRGVSVEHSQALTYQVPQSAFHTQSFASITSSPIDVIELIEIDPNQTFEIEARFDVL